MPFIRHLLSKGKPSTYTVMLIPGKYGSSRALRIPRWLIMISMLFSIVFFLLFFASAGLLIARYNNLKMAKDKSEINIESLKVINNTQAKQIDDYKRVEDDMKLRLKELEDLETQLRNRLDSSAKLPSVITASFSNDTISITEVDKEIDSLYSLMRKFDMVTDSLKRVPTIFPCGGHITSYYGGRANPTSRGRTEFHDGVDIANSYGTIIHAAADGIVERTGWMNGYGIAVVINHLNGYTTIYGHNSKLLVKAGQKVKKGQVISRMGSTGRSTGTHVHFEIRLDGHPVNPLKLIKGGI